MRIQFLKIIISKIITMIMIFKYSCSINIEEFRPLYNSFVPFFSILSCDPPLVGLDTESSEVVQETPHPLLFLPPRGNRAPPYEFSEHHALRQSRVLHARHKPREQNPPLAQCRLDALALRFHEGVEVGNRVISATMLSQSDAAGQEVVVRTAQRVVVARGCVDPM